MITIGAFTGIRTENIQRMRWSSVHWKTRHIVLDAEASKTVRCVVPLKPNLRRWLKPLKEDERDLICRYVNLTQQFYRVTTEIQRGQAAQALRQCQARQVISCEIQRGQADVELVSVMNNDPGSGGAAGPAVLLKAIEEGATVLDAYAVKSKRFSNGFLPELYAGYGFKEVGRIKFDPQYMTETQLADLKHLWEVDGWDRKSDPPDIVVMEVYR